MNNEQLKELLTSLNACEESLEWIEDRNADQMWADCPRGDWMLWLMQKCGLNKRKLTLAKGKCAETVKHLMKDERSINAVEVAIRYGYSEATEEELTDAAAAVYAAAADAAVYDAAAAVYAAAAAAAAAADAAVYAADAADAKKENQLLTANICREIVPFNEMIELLKSKKVKPKK